MNYALARDYYSKKQTTSLVSEATANELISLILQQLVNSLENYRTVDNRVKAVGYKSNALVALFTLQSSLDFEKGGEIAINLYRLYEFVRLSLLEANDTGKDNIALASKLMSEILEAWKQIE